MKNGFVFIETIIVICVLTVSLMSLYANYSKILGNVKELNTFDTTEYNYKTYFLKNKFGSVTSVVDDSGSTVNFNANTCVTIQANFSDNGIVKMCKFDSVSSIDFIASNKSIMDAYIIDYLNSQEFDETNDNLFLVEYKKEDKQNAGEYFTYISALNY